MTPDGAEAKPCRGAPTRNLDAVPLESLPATDVQAFRRKLLDAVGEGGRLVALLAPSASALVAVVARDERRQITLLRAALSGRVYPALTPQLPSAQAFEREIFETRGIRPEGHPWLKPLRRHADLEAREDGGAGGPDPHPFFQVDGAGVHEVAVGPVHAGIIEPGHFRFQCAGERVLHLEIQLGYQHRGAQALLLRSKPARRLVVAESIAGDTSVGHALAYASAMEALAGGDVSAHAHAVRAIALELERLANHVGDLGALCNDVGHLPGAAWFGRLRGEFLNLLLELSGNRFGRGLVVPGGVRSDAGPTAAQRRDWTTRLDAAERDLRGVAELVFDAPSVCSRFERTGAVTRELATALGLVGPAARASGCDRDARRDHPVGAYRSARVAVVVMDAGDVMARALVRWRETERSIDFVRARLSSLPEPEPSVPLPPLTPRRMAVALIEGWRGEIAHVAMTGPDGVLAAYHVVDPSFHNWFGLALAMRGQAISDFPLCNKSFNLSYAGHDL